MSRTPEPPSGSPSIAPAASSVDAGRPRLLFGASVVPVAAATGLTVGSAPARAALKTSARIVIAGSGLGGLAAANRLARELDGAKITIVDRKEIHNYQPGYTLVATGVWPVEKVSDRNADLIPAGVEWVREMVAEFDPEANAVVTDSGRRIEYDYLIVATGLQIDFAQIEGKDVAAIGSNGLGCVYPSPQAAQATWQAMDAYRQKGGKALMTLPATPLKCAGAPLKMTFLVVNRLRQAGTRERSQVEFHSALDNIFSVPRINQEVLARWDKLGVPVTFNSKLVAIDVGARRATFTSPEGERSDFDYDFIHVVPPMRAPDVVKNSPLSWKEGGFAAGGWLEVDKETLRHRRFPNVFGIGDINGTPKGKTAATVKKGTPLVVFVVVTAITFFITPGMTRSSFANMGYWVDWGNLFLYAAGFGGVAAALVWPLAAMMRRAG